MNNSQIKHNIPGPAAGGKTDKTFMILSFLGILFVVDSHLGSPFSMFTSVFPYDSYYMPMFVFISGYFFQDKYCRSLSSLIGYAKRKFSKLLLPYLGWILFYGLLTWILRFFTDMEIGTISLIDLLQNIATAGTSFGFNDPAWFVPLLFCVTIGYCFIRFLFAEKWNDYTGMLVLSVFGACAVFLSNTWIRTNNTYMLLKIPFFLQFYHLAVLFRNHLEKYFEKCNALAVCVVAVLVNCVLLNVYGYDIGFPLCASMSGFYTNNLFLPLITSVTGIAFWLKISKTLVPVFGQNALVNYISDHTAFIMTHHVGVKHLFIGLLLFGSKCGITAFSGIDAHLFRTDPWYCYTDHVWLSVLCFLFTMAFLVVSCKAGNRLFVGIRARMHVK